MKSHMYEDSHRFKCERGRKKMKDIKEEKNGQRRERGRHKGLKRRRDKYQGWRD